MKFQENLGNRVCFHSVHNITFQCFLQISDNKGNSKMNIAKKLVSHSYITTKVLGHYTVVTISSVSMRDGLRE